MKSSLRNIILAASLTAIILLGACGSESEICAANDNLLKRMQAQVPFKEFSLSFNVIEEERSLNFWVVDPNLDGSAENQQSSLEASLLAATEIIHTFNTSYDCFSAEFDVINLIIVDPNYFGWFSGKLDPATIPTQETVTEDELIEVAISFAADFILTYQLDPTEPRPEGSCTWAETRKKIRTHFPQENPNIEFFLINNNETSSIWAQWIVEEDVADPIESVLDSLLSIVTELDCIYPLPDQILTTVINLDGEAIILGTLPQVDTGTGSLLNGFDINYYDWIIRKPENE